MHSSEDPWKRVLFLLTALSEQQVELYLVVIDLFSAPSQPESKILQNNAHRIAQ